MNENRIHIADYIVFGVTLLLSLSIGVYFSCTGGKQKSVDEYLVGDRKISFLPVAVSLLVTFQSGISLLGLPVEIYYYGTQISMGIIGLVLGYLFVAVFLVPVFYPLQITSVYEYLQLRFKSKAVRVAGSVLGLLFTVTYMAVALFIPSIALEAVTGFSVNISIPLIAVVTVIYTVLGGMKAVVWTDVLQFTVMLAGIITMLVKGTIESGGIVNVWETCKANERTQFFDINPDPTTRQTFWAVTIGTMTSWIGNGISQSGIQRLCSTSSIREARKVVLANLPAAVLLECLMAFTGLVLFAYYYTQGCDPVNAGYIQSSNQLVPYFVLEHMSSAPGFVGLFMACLFSATLSTLSSGLSAISALVWGDIIEPYFQKTNGTTVTRVTVLISGIVVVGLAFLAMNLKGTITQITLGTLSATSGPLVGVFLLGVASPWSNAKSAVTGGAVAFCLVTTMSVGAFLFPVDYEQLSAVPTSQCFNTTNLYISNVTVQQSTTHMMNTASADMANSSSWLFRVSFLWYHLVGVVTTLIVGIIMTLITGGINNLPAETQYILVILRKWKFYQRSRTRDRMNYFSLQRVN